MLEALASFLPFIGIVIVVGAAVRAAHWLLLGRHQEFGNERKFPRQLIMVGLTLVGVLVCILGLPVGESSRNQLIGLMGIVISGVLAFSSTTIISNLMGGLLLRITKPFKVGDFIRIGDHFGRVSERGLFDTEIQTETRELIALPNTYCISNPVATIRSSGTIISATLSLGYDIDHTRVERLLLEAARTCGLQEPFVHIMELGNYAVTYRVSGFLEEPKRLISVHSRLFGCVLDTLHSQGIEIMSPSYMNQRRLRDGERAIPSTTVVTGPDEPQTAAEEIAFDKAERAEELENQKQQLIREMQSLEEALRQITDEEQKKAKEEAIEERRKRLKSLEVAAQQAESQDEKAQPLARPDAGSAAPRPRQ